MSTNTLSDAVATSTAPANRAIAWALAKLGARAASHLTAAEVALGDLPVLGDPTGADDVAARAEEAFRFGVTSHATMKLAEALLLTLADERCTGEVDPALVFAVGAADRTVVESLRAALREVPDPDSRPLAFAVNGELRLALAAADKMGESPDTVPEEW